MRTTILPAVLLALGLLLPSTGAPGAAEDKQPATAKLIEQLGSDDFDEREKAARLLQARGPAVLPALRKALDHPDAEVRRRARELVATLETAAALEPKRVTLTVEKKPLSDVLAEIRKQTGYKVEATGDSDDKPYSFEMKGVPLWEALERIGKETGRGVHAPLLEKGIRLKRREGRSPFVALSGPFRLELTRFHEDRDIDFTAAGKEKPDGTRGHLLTLTVSVMAEPRFLLLDAEPARVTVALDEDKKALAAPPPREEKAEAKPGAEVNFERTDLGPDFQRTARILLQRSSEKARTIKVLRGSVPVKVVVARKPVVVTENVLAAAGTKFEIGGDTLEIVKATEDDGKYYNLCVRVPPERGRVRLHWHDRIHLEDAKGHRYKPVGEGTQRNGDDWQILLSYMASKDPAVGPPGKLIVEDWVTIQHQVPFEFKDVPLP